MRHLSVCNMEKENNPLIESAKICITKKIETEEKPTKDAIVSIII